jgi:aspartyl-tRNA(Asn)/glutamyl-tRNA(Gln) amidotransferase subunit C
VGLHGHAFHPGAPSPFQLSGFGMEPLRSLFAMSTDSPHHTIDVSYLARLARLEITAEEAKTFGAQIGRILDHVEQMNRLDITGIEPTAHAITVFDVIREDAVTESLPKKTILENAPHNANGLFIVPKVLD